LLVSLRRNNTQECLVEVLIGIHAQENTRSPCAPAPADNVRQNRTGSAAAGTVLRGTLIDLPGAGPGAYPAVAGDGEHISDATAFVGYGDRRGQLRVDQWLQMVDADKSDWQHRRL